MKSKLITPLVLLIIVLIFVLQNSADIQVKLLVWEFSLSLWSLLFVMLLIGAVIGWFSRALYRLSRKKRQP